LLPGPLHQQSQEHISWDGRQSQDEVLILDDALCHVDG
jgi:hypothetical protein